jgi:hypothetical protein
LRPRVPPRGGAGSVTDSVNGTQAFLGPSREVKSAPICNRNILFGIKADGDWSNQQGSGSSLSFSTAWLATARIRVGYAYIATATRTARARHIDLALRGQTATNNLLWQNLGRGGERPQAQHHGHVLYVPALAQHHHTDDRLDILLSGSSISRAASRAFSTSPFMLSAQTTFLCFLG